MEQDIGPGERPEFALGLEAVRLSQWRRMVLHGDGPELTIAEAAVVLGVSVENVRRRIKSGQLLAYHDGNRIRVVPSLGSSRTAPALPLPDATEQMARLWEAFKDARQQLSHAQHERQDLETELASLKSTLTFLERKVRNLSEAPPEAEPPEPPSDRQRLQAQIIDIRNLARRRMKPWALVG